MPEKNVLITGASRGIGAACAKKFASHGFSEIINYRSSDESARRIKDECISLGSPKAVALRADVSKASDVDSLYSEATSQLGFIDTIDLYAILGNVMDNAIEAVEKPYSRIIT